MKSILTTFAGLLLVVAATGCQCCGITERYADLIDDVSDCSPKLDRFYHAELDLNRIGKPDWCRSKINRLLCGRGCCGGCGGCGSCGYDCGDNSHCNCPTPCPCCAEASPNEAGGEIAPAPVAPAPPSEPTGQHPTGENGANAWSETRPTIMDRE